MLDLHFFLISHTLASSRIAGPSTSLLPLPTTQFLLSVMGMRHIHGKESRFLRVNFLTEEFVTTFQKKKKKTTHTSRLFSPFFLPALCQSSIEQETTHFISVTRNDGLVLQPRLILRTSISQAESLNVPCLEGLLIWCRWTAQEELIHSLQQFFSDHYIM